MPQPTALCVCGGILVLRGQIVPLARVGGGGQTTIDSVSVNGFTSNNRRCSVCPALFSRLRLATPKRGVPDRSIGVVGNFGRTGASCPVLVVLASACALGQFLVSAKKAAAALPARH
eukprot:TRINITY_DN5228_c0_g2_i1.p5 TRINITY_DN5228_c0_g2~~TRINITY_DN5228_c0_g2_i1.p5  ORF type:complete len:117 (+),score=3.82 TRINITY_DN5228_c0_g2_i1:313-663(+)